VGELKVKVAINGFGTIGKRVADAISKQPDMEVIGVSKTRPNYEALIAIKKKYKLYVPRDKIRAFEDHGIEVSGAIEELISRADIVIDATPAGVGARNKDLYIKLGKPAIFQGGERSEVADISFNAMSNYEKALGKRYVRVVSCNTTGLLRIISVLEETFGVRSVFATIIRRGADPKEIKKGPINAITLDPPHIPSHHAIDVQRVLPHIPILTVALAVPTTLMHVHVVRIELSKEATVKDIIEVIEKAPRILLIEAEKHSIKSTAELIEWARDLGRSRYDIPELVIWRDTISITNGRKLTLVQGIHQESIVIPENVDAIRAILKIVTKARDSMRITDENLGLKRWW